jgi:signal peptidase I
MLPTLQVGDHLLITKLQYGLRLPIVGGWVIRYRDPAPGDVIVFTYPQDRGKDFIKRVVAVAGEEIEVRHKTILVDGVPRDVPQAYFADDGESLAPVGPRDEYGPVLVPAGHLFVMGDNRDRSYDSRFWGFVDVEDVQGKAIVVYWSWDGRDRWVRWERLGTIIH